jgi:histidine triad (HIT) family protein
MSDCIFCKIASGKIPSTKIFESEHFFAILDLNPVKEGHALVIPKRHFEIQTEMNDDERKDFGVALGAVADLLKKEFGEHMNFSNTSGKFASQSIPHYHMHIIPRQEADRLWDGDKSRLVLDTSSGFPRLKLPKEEIAQLAKKLKGDTE